MEGWRNHQAGGLLGKTGSPRLNLPQARAYAKFKVGELFSVETPKRRFNANAVKFGGVHPYVVRTSQNNGRRGTIIADEKWLNPGKTISFGQDTATIFYQPQPYFTGDKIKVMSFLKGVLNERVACYFLAAMRKSFASFSWGTSSFNENVLKEVVVSLPVVDEDARQLDLAYMESYIRELESARVRELEKWLSASGLNNYCLTVKERRAIEDWHSGRVRSTTFKIGDLFELKKGKRLTKADMKTGDINFIGATSENNGITAHISNSEHLHSPNTITVSYNGSVGEAFYQSKPFWASDDINVFYAKFRMDESSALYLISLIKQQGRKYSYSSKWTKEEMEETELLVPVAPNGLPDVDFMSQYIHATIKQVIRGVNEWKDREIAEIKKAVDLPSDSMLAIDKNDDDIANMDSEEFLKAAGLPSRDDGDGYVMPPEETLS